MLSLKGTASNITTGCQCDPRGPSGSPSHTLEVLGLCPQLHEVLGSCGGPMGLLPQNGNGLSGVAAGLLGVLPIITGNCGQNAKIGTNDAKGVKRCGGCFSEGESDSC